MMEESTFLTSFNLHSPGLNEMNVSATFPADALAMVCDQLESFSTTTNVAKRKHETNRTIIALSGVCRSWRGHITSRKGLFRNIAFDFSSKESIVTSGIFLKALEGTAVPISVYASLGQSADRDPMVVRLFTQLRPHIPYIVHFEYDGDMARYRPYLDRPAPNLLFFSDNFDTYPGRGPPLFCSQMPRLRVLTTLSPAPQVLWVTSTLSDLTTLNLGFLDIGPCIPLSSFLDLLRGSPRLESLCVLCFVPVVDPNEDLEDVFLACLHTLVLQHNEFHTIVKRLKIPSLRKLFFSGESYPASGEELNPTFEAPHLFAGLPSLPILERPIQSIHLKTTGDGRTDADFCLRLAVDGGFVLDVSLVWVLESIPLCDGYARRSVLWLIGMMSVAPQAQVTLSLAHLAPLCIPIYQPFLLVTGINQLTVQGGFTVDVLEKLTVRAGVHPLLPCLRLLNITGRLPFSDREGGKAVLSCIQSRAVMDVHFSIRLMDTEVCFAGLGEPRYIVKRDAEDSRFVIIAADPLIAQSKV